MKQNYFLKFISLIRLCLTGMASIAKILLSSSTTKVLHAIIEVIYSYIQFAKVDGKIDQDLLIIK
ncbi:hypothetical protein SAMN04487764_0155 [Gillisia sp. Hel1_33_143]|uniref:hypothetical protein n=1 Tax=Gillisia sp. Hel_I_29 TaxID=1249975 RepID=UPI000553421F|nr:hypothetical protein [Gillisia sp. Hel_I_29]SDR67371.1 hypothetical protein SAMN04487764_0155 [Gillisia sp. Hel1_33_143]